MKPRMYEEGKCDRCGQQGYLVAGNICPDCREQQIEEEYDHQETARPTER